MLWTRRPRPNGGVKWLLAQPGLEPKSPTHWYFLQGKTMSPACTSWLAGWPDLGSQHPLDTFTYSPMGTTQPVWTKLSNCPFSWVLNLSHKGLFSCTVRNLGIDLDSRTLSALCLIIRLVTKTYHFSLPETSSLPSSLSSTLVLFHLCLVSLLLPQPLACLQPGALQSQLHLPLRDF